MLIPLALALATIVATGSPAIQNTDQTRRLIGQVTVSARFLVFSYAGDLWRTDLDGGVAENLTEGPAEDAYPVVSPDGNWIAFSRQAGGDWDVYTIPINGGEARRQTYHPEADIVRGWTPDGERILFMSHRDEEGVFRLYTIGQDGVFPTPLPLPRGYEGSYSAEADRIAYVPHALPTEVSGTDWRYYRGGLTAPIWLADLGDSSIERIPRENSNDRFPMWQGEDIYFVSDRTGTNNLFVYSTSSKKVAQLTRYDTYGITHASAGGGRVAFVQDGALRLFHPSTGVIDSVSVEVSPDTSELVPRSVPIAPYIQSADISKLGDKVVFSARGEIISYDRLSGIARNITNSKGVADRYPALSPDGQWVAYVSDEGGEYQLKIRRADGDGEVLRTGQIELRPTFYRELSWSPDSKRLAFVDKRLTLWVANFETGGATRIATSTHSNQGSYHISWSPNGTIISYSQYESNGNRAIYLYDVVRARKRQVTSGDVNAEHPTFDRSGKYLFFVASSDAALGVFGWSVLSAVLHRPLVTRRLHVVVLRNDIPAPVMPVTGEPNLEALADSGQGRALIHTEGIERRIVPLPVAAKDYIEVSAGRYGELYLLVNEWPHSPAFGTNPTRSLYRYRLSQPDRMERFIEGIEEYELSGDASTVLFRRGEEWAVVPTAEPPGDDVGVLNLDALSVEIDPRSEWNQMYQEAWRFMRDYFYDPDHHGQNVRRLETHFSSYLPTITRRRDLNALLNQGLGQISAGHLAVSGGDIAASTTQNASVGLLGADYELAEGRYRITRIHRSGHYHSPNRSVRAPLDQPGVDVAAGEFLLEVDGERVRQDRNIYSYFEGKAGQSIEIRVGPEVGATGSRTFTVVPIEDESALRRANWAADRARRVEELTQGQVAYLYVASFGSGLEDFFREMLANQKSKGFVIDARYAGGDVTSDYMIELLRRSALYYYAFRNGDDIAIPTNPMPDAKVLLVNNASAAAAESFALMFKLGGLGRVIGSRTTGIGVGPYAFIPTLVDRGRVTIPNRAPYNPAGTWGIENEGVEPNIPADNMPKDWRQGSDPQLETAVRLVLQRIVDNAPNVVEPKKPEYPVHPRGGTATADEENVEDPPEQVDFDV